MENGVVSWLVLLRCTLASYVEHIVVKFGNLGKDKYVGNLGKTNAKKAATGDTEQVRLLMYILGKVPEKQTTPKRIATLNLCHYSGSFFQLNIRLEYIRFKRLMPEALNTSSNKLNVDRICRDALAKLLSLDLQ